MFCKVLFLERLPFHAGKSFFLSGFVNNFDGVRFADVERYL
jgi:hypothetical protein